MIQDDVTVYGYESNTGLKILIGFDNVSSVTPKDLKGLFGDVHKVYIKTICNPFLEVGGEEGEVLQTPTFDKRIKELVTKWNS